MRDVAILQWYGNGRAATLAGFVELLRVVRKHPEVRVGPFEPAHISAVGFWAEGPRDSLDAIEHHLAERAEVLSAEYVPVRPQ